MVGITQASLLVACMMGRNFSLITPSEKMVPLFHEVMRRYGLEDRLAGIESMDFRIPDLGRVFEDPAMQQKQVRAFTEGARKTIASRAEVIVPMGGIASLFLARSGLR